VPGRDVAVFVEWTGWISAWDAAARTVSRLGSGWSEPEGIAVAADGKTAFVTERGGSVLKVDLSAADRAAASALVDGLEAPHQLVLSADGAALFVVEFGSAGRLLRVDLPSGGVDVVASGLEGEW
jgi:DNA-binding beta-propeller fold protein YncE